MNGRRTRYTLGSFAVIAFLMLGSVCANAQSPDSEKVNDLFQNIRQHAVLAEEDAEILESYTRSSVSWESHARQIEKMRDHVKDLADDYNQAASLRSEASPWQQDAIDHLHPLLQGMADHIKATIDRLSKNQSRTRMQSWIDYVHANREYAVKAAALIRDYVSYGEAKSTADALERKLEIGQSAGEE